MNIYFACSITGGREFEPAYQEITRALLADGHTVPTAMLADSSVKEFESIVEPVEVYERDTAWIRGCDALVAEVSTPSHGVGYEVAYALARGKPVLCLHQQARAVSKMLTGNRDPHLQVSAYTEPAQAVTILQAFLVKFVTKDR